MAAAVHCHAVEECAVAAGHEPAAGTSHPVRRHGAHVAAHRGRRNVVEELFSNLLDRLGRFKSVTAEYLLISFVTLIFVSMVRLIRDLDDPFEYGPQGERGAADVDLFPLVE